MPRLALATLIGLVLAVSAGCQSTPTQVGPAPRHEALALALEGFIEHEMGDKTIPGFSIVLVDDGEIVWARGFGEADPQTGDRATASTVYRVGSVSKLLTDLAVMQLVEQGKLSLDAPVTDYLSDFSPHNRFGKPITLRQLMCHRSGLVREPPVGSYFDPDEPGLEATVQSLNETSLVYEPTRRYKYSNAGVSVVGRVLEAVVDRPFTEYMREAVLLPLGMTQSGFSREAVAAEQDVASGTMWTYDGRTSRAPTFELGTSPAGSLYASVIDLARLMRVLFDRGAIEIETESDRDRFLEAATLESMWQPQFTDRESGFGLGFAVGELDGHRTVGHNGAIYGFSTGFTLLPDAKVGVAAVSTLDVTNRVVDRIVRYALRGLLAVREGRALPDRERTTPIDPARARQLAGQYTENLRLLERDGELFLDQGGTYLTRLQAQGDDLVVDGRLGFGTRLELRDEGKLIAIGDRVFQAVPRRVPEPAPVRWKGLIGEYGHDHNVLYIYEKNGKLHALIEWFFSYPLTEEPGDVFAFPDYGLYHGEKLIFERDDLGVASRVRAAQVDFERRDVGVAAGETFRIEPLLPGEKLREIARAAEPPEEEGAFLRTDFVELKSLDPTILYDIRYATTNNFMGMVFYKQAKAFLQRPAAEAVQRVHERLIQSGYGLYIHDAYRPWYVTKMFWDATPESMKDFVANPQNGSRHNRGCAIDLTLYDLRTLKPVQMVGGYDEFTPRSFPYYPGGTSRQRYFRDWLRREMQREGFTVYEYEWWHFDYGDWKRYPIHNVSFEEILAGQGE